MTLDDKPPQVERITSPSRPSSLESTRNNSQIREEGDIEKAFATHEDKDVTAIEIQPIDPDLVDWDGPDDPENPLNWPAKRKYMNIALLSIITLLTFVAPLTAPSQTSVWQSLTDVSDHSARLCLRRPYLR